MIRNGLISCLSLCAIGRGAAMIIESLRLFYHLRCFQCCVCQIQLGNGASGTDVRVRNNKLHCQNCYSNDEGKSIPCIRYDMHIEYRVYITANIIFSIIVFSF